MITDLYMSPSVAFCIIKCIAIALHIKIEMHISLLADSSRSYLHKSKASIVTHCIELMTVVRKLNRFHLVRCRQALWKKASMSHRTES